MYKKDLELQINWVKLVSRLEQLLGKRPKDLNGVLFLIGVQELGNGKQNFSKEEKQDLMHIAICKVLSLSGFYELEGIDNDGWPHWKKTDNYKNHGFFTLCWAYPAGFIRLSSDRF